MPFPRTHAIADHDCSTADRTAVSRQQRRVVKDYDRDPLGGNRTAPTLVPFNDPGDPVVLRSQTNGTGRRLLARLAASRLDRQLASGVPPESSGLLAARAEDLVSPPVRRALARRWESILVQVHRPPVMRDPRVRLCRQRIIAAEDEVRAMVRALMAPLPVPPRGVAMVNQLLGDGAGPLYNPDSAIDVGTALRMATELLDPTVPLSQPA
jgi:hypothetical protein